MSNEPHDGDQSKVYLVPRSDLDRDIDLVDLVLMITRHPLALVIVFAAALMGLDPPPLIAFEDADLSPMAKSFYGENKRIKNTRIKQELGVKLKYSSYREGLRALFDSQDF